MNVPAASAARNVPSAPGRRQKSRGRQTPRPMWRPEPERCGRVGCGHPRVGERRGVGHFENGVGPCKRHGCRCIFFLPEEALRPLAGQR